MFVYVIAMPVRSGPRAGPGSSCRGGGPCSPPSSHCGDSEERELGARNRPKRPKIPRVRLGDVCGGLGCINCHRHGVAILRFNTRSSTRFSRALVSYRFWGGGGVFFFYIWGEMYLLSRGGSFYFLFCVYQLSVKGKDLEGFAPCGVVWLLLFCCFGCSWLCGLWVLWGRLQLVGGGGGVG